MSEGKVSDSMDKFIMLTSEGHKTSPLTFSSLAGISSGPVAFLGFNFLIYLSTWSSVTGLKLKFGKTLSFIHADDNTLSFHDKDKWRVKSQLETAADIGIKWFKENDMKANPGKFQAMVLSSGNSQQMENDFCFEIEGANIYPEKAVKLLGIFIDNKLKFHEHISHICKQAAKQLSVLRRFSRVLNEREKLLIFNVFLLSNFNYCPLVWHLCGLADTCKMEKIQERAHFSSTMTHCSPMLSYCNVLKTFLILKSTKKDLFGGSQSSQAPKPKPIFSK